MDIIAPLPKSNSCIQYVVFVNSRYSEITWVTTASNTSSLYFSVVFCDHWIKPYGIASFLSKTMAHNWSPAIQKHFELFWAEITHSHCMSRPKEQSGSNILHCAKSNTAPIGAWATKWKLHFGAGAYIRITFPSQSLNLKYPLQCRVLVTSADRPLLNYPSPLPNDDKFVTVFSWSVRDGFTASS